MSFSRLKDRLKFRLKALELGSKRLSNPFHVSLPLVMITGDLSIGKRLAELSRHLENTHGGLLCFLEFLLHRIILGFEG